MRYYTDVFGTFGKHVQDSFGTPELAPWLKEVLDIVFGGPEAVRERMPMSFLITPTSPLTIEHDFTQTWLELRDYGLPVAVMPMPLQGATAPGSRLGTLLAANCETIGTLCLVQAAAPGTPVLYSPVVATMDPRTGLYAAGAVEHAVLCVAGTEMARYYGLPAESSGLCTQTYEPDLQTAWEKADSGLLVALADPDVLVGPGLLGGATILCLEQIVLDVEMIRGARQARTGVPVRDDLWLDEVLDKVGPCGSFLGERSTRSGARERRVAPQRLRRAGQLGRVAGGGVAEHPRRRRRARRGHPGRAGLAAVQRRPGGGPRGAAAPRRRRLLTPPRARPLAPRRAARLRELASAPRRVAERAPRVRTAVRKRLLGGGTIRTIYPVRPRIPHQFTPRLRDYRRLTRRE